MNNWRMPMWQNNTKDIAELFVNELEAERFTVDKTGAKTIEIIGASFIADQPAIFGTPNQDYIDAEIEWYESMSTNVGVLEDIYGKTPSAWEYSANEFGEINSNYGKLIFCPKYHNQFRNAVDELMFNPDSRRACMVYNRPSIWVEYDEDGKNDFICTNAVTYYIRDKKLHGVVQMRSNDVVFGYRNDYAWQQWVLNEMCDELEVEPGDIHWQVQNLHVYERHFNLVRQ